MGADLLLWYAPVPAPDERRWDAADARIDALPDDELRMEYGGTPTEAREQLRADLKEFRRVVEAHDPGSQERGSRDAAVCLFGGRPYIITGGMSSGDSPTEFSEVMQRLGEAGVLDAAGFTDADTNAITIKLTL